MSGVGIVLCAFGLWLAGRSMLLLAGRGRPQRGRRPSFVIAGPYRRVRNPAFGGVVIAATGAALAACSTAIGVAAVVTAVGAHAWVVFVEEPRLRARFGRAYEAYLERVPRWLPRGGRRAGANVGVDPDE